MAQALQSGLRRSCDTVARYGGEEFAILLPSTDAKGARVRAEALRVAIAGLDLRHEAHPMGHVTISLGVATLIPEAAVSAAELVKAADRALYRAKASGKNRVEAN